MTRFLVASTVVLGCGVALMQCGPPPATEACKGRLAGDLVITEAMVDPDGADTGAEWIEVYNALGTPLDLKGMTLYVKDLDGTKLKSHVIKAGSAISLGYFVLGDVRGGANPAWVNYSYGDTLGSMGNARGIIGIRCGTTVLDEVTYTTAAKSGRSRMLADGSLVPSAVNNDNEANWCDAPTGSVYLAPNAGTPGSPNPQCMPEVTLPTCLEEGVPRPIVPPRAGDLIITEVMASPAKANDATGRWFEVLAQADVDLNGVTVQNGAGSVDTFSSKACVRVVRGEYALLARSADSFLNGDLPPPKALYSLSFASGNERILLRSGDAGIDEIAVRTSASGKAWQLDPARLDGVSNDDPANFCRAPNRWNSDGGSDFGSPGAANPACPETDAGVTDGGMTDAGMPDAGPVVDPNRCLDPVSQVMRDLRRPAVGDLVITEWMADPVAVSDTVGEYFEVLVKADSDLNGLVLGDASSITTIVQHQSCLSVSADSLVLFAHSDNPLVNGNLPPVAATFAFDLNNTTRDTIRVLGADGGVLDTVSYASARPGVSTQLDQALRDAADNDDAGSLCPTLDAGANRYGPTLPDGGPSGDVGTPGRLNDSCR
jgi:hypothetical protein